MYDQPEQAIRNPFGITVFGSAITRIAPDLASVKVSVARLEPEPAVAFSEARRGSKAVQDCLRAARISEFGASRVTLSQKHSYSNGQTKFDGYQARVSFHIMLTELDRVEDLLTALVAAGANEVDEMSFQTTRLKELRAEARRRAMAAALDKANIYCAAAGVRLGNVLHIEDVNPSVLRGNEGHVRTEPQIDDEGDARAFDSGAISVGAAVLVAYSIGDGTP